MHNQPFTPSDVSQRRDKRWHGHSVSHEAFVGFPCIYRAHRPYWRGKHLEPAAGDLGLCQSGSLQWETWVCANLGGFWLVTLAMSPKLA